MKMKKLTIDFLNVLVTVTISYIAFTLIDKLFKLLDYQKVILVFTMLLNNVIIANNINLYDQNTDLLNFLIILFFDILFILVYISNNYKKQICLENMFSTHYNFIKTITNNI